MDNFKNRLMNGLRTAKKVVVGILKAPLKKLVIIIAIFALVIISLGASYDALMDQFSKRVGEHMKNNSVEYEYEDRDGDGIPDEVGAIVIDEEQIEILEKMLADMGTSKEKLHLTTENLEKMYAAEVITQEINRGATEEDGKYYGRVYVKRATESTEEEDLQDLEFMPFEQFKLLGADEILNYYSVNEDKLCVASTRIETDENGNQIEKIAIQKLDYKGQILPYMMPVEFLLNLCIITENPEFVMALADKVIKETKIVIAVLEETEEVETITTRKFKIESETMTYTRYYDNEGKYIEAVWEEPSITVSDEQEEKNTEIVTTVTPIIKIVYIDSWFIEQRYTYNKVTTENKTNIPDQKLEDEEKDGHDYSIIDETTNEEGITTSETYSSTISREIERSLLTDITTTRVTYQEGITKEPLDKADEFIELLKTPFKKPDSFRKETAIGDIVNGSGILLQMLQNSERTQAVEHIMRYVLYKYTGDNYGVTELDLSLFETNNFTTISNTSLSTYLRQFSHSTEAPQSADGKYYLMFGDGAGWPTIGNADLQWKSHHSKFNVSGKVWNGGTEELVSSVEEYVNSYLTKGAEAEYTDTEIYDMQIYIEKELVDNIGDSLQKSYYDTVVSATSGLSLSRQQLYALTVVKYNFGHLPIRNGKAFREVYEEGAALYEINSGEHNKYIWDNWWCYLGGGEPGHIPARDAAFETYVKGVYDFSQSSAGEVFSRNYYIYYTQEQLDMFDYAPTKTVTRTSSNESEIFEYEENTVGTSGITSVGDLELSTYTNSAGKTFIEYKQNEGPWASMSYGDGTIAAQGCSITSLAIMTSGYGYNYTPDEWSGTSLISMTEQSKKYAPNSTRISIGEEGTANTNVSIVHKNQIQEHLETGNAVIIHVLGTKRGYNNPYTSNQHWMVLLDINDDGSEVYVSNPYVGKTNGWADIDQVLKSLCCYIKIEN